MVLTGRQPWCWLVGSQKLMWQLPEKLREWDRGLSAHRVIEKLESEGERLKDGSQDVTLGRGAGESNQQGGCPCVSHWRLLSKLTTNTGCIRWSKVSGVRKV